MNIIRKLYNAVLRAYDTQVDATGLAVFRMAYSCVLFFEIIHLYKFRHLIYDKIPYVEMSEVSWAWPIGLWAIAVACLGLGLAYRWAAWTNYVLTLVCISTATSYEYHMYYVYVGINFLLIFIPAQRRLSVDRLFLQLRAASSKGAIVLSKTTSILSYQIPVFVGIGLVYFDSVFHKLDSNSWLDGLGMWLPASLPMISQIDSSVMMNQKWLVVGMSYLTLVFEFLFIFIFWKRRFWLPLFVIGMGLHLGILLEFPIPYFALGVMSLYLLIVPAELWRKISVRKSQSSLQVYYDLECPLCRRTREVVRFFDWFGNVELLALQNTKARHKSLEAVGEDQLYASIYSVNSAGTLYEGINTYRAIFKHLPLFWCVYAALSLPGCSHLAKWFYAWVARNRHTERCSDGTCALPVPMDQPVSAKDIKVTHQITLFHLQAALITLFLVLVVSLQAIMIADSPLMRRVYGIWWGADERGQFVISKNVKNVREVAAPLFGITRHGVFLDSHYEGYNHLIKVTHVESGTVLPITNDDGSLGDYLHGNVWAKWGFRANGTEINSQKLKTGIRDFTAFWMRQEQHSMRKPQHFVIHAKYIPTPSGWEKDYYSHCLKGEWAEVGQAQWSDNIFTSSIEDIESTITN
jgi:predicted DCC family thiol-disulfide oxidoreductase YuxK